MNQTDPTAAVWIDGDPLMEAIAAAIWERCERGGNSTVFDDPRNIAAVAATVARTAASAVVSPPTDRAAWLTEAADRIDRMDLPQGFVDMFDNGARWATAELRRMAVEAQSCRWEHPHPGYQCEPRTVVEAHGTGTPQPPVPQRAYPDCERCGDTGVDPERDGAEPCPECQQTNVPAPVETDEERADREATERDHARGDHTYCGITCETEMPTEHLRNFVIAKGYPGTRGALDELLRRARAEVAEQQPAAEAEQDDTVHACPGRWGGPNCRCFDAEPAPGEQQAAAADGEETRS